MKKEKAAPRSVTKDGVYADPGSKVIQKSRYCKSRAVKLLEALADHAARAKYPTVPHLAPRRFRDDTANGLTQCIIQFLRLTGHQAERISNTGRPIDTRRSFTDVVGNRREVGTLTWIPGSGTRGSADISATILGRSVKIEVKIGTDRQSAAQREYQNAVTQAGGIYYIARDFSSFLDWYNLTFEADE